MSEGDSKFAGSIPALYDQYLAPLMFEPYAADLAQRLADTRGGDLLEIAAGTGVLTRALAQSLPPTVTIVATDLNQPMLDFASMRSTGARAITWRQANALGLPFQDESFDVVVCQFGVMFFPEKYAAYREVRRVLKTSGRFVFSVWDRIEENDIAQAIAEGVASLFPLAPPDFMARTPHGYYDTNRIQAELRGAGFNSVKVDIVALRSTAPSAEHPAIGFCQGSPLRNEIEARASNRLAEATQAAAAVVRAKFSAGAINAKMQAHVITAKT
jgi:ubiquinone/menaquinone biosynthesis C-methylase UbiE